MIEFNVILHLSKDLDLRLRTLLKAFIFDEKSERLREIKNELESPSIWKEPEKAQTLGKERAELEKATLSLAALTHALQDTRELLELAHDPEEEDMLCSIAEDLNKIKQQIEKLEFEQMFSKKRDEANCYLEIQAGSGGTEAQDWAEMLLRMYLRFGEQHGFTTELIEASPGEVAGIKSATIRFEGAYAFGWLRTETGIHRLVRKSPFDSGNRRHTSFASVFASPEVEDDIAITINPADLRIDTYRASGAGGQHVNRTDSAVRITHIPSGAVVQCQSDRSQHKNKSQALKQLKAKLYELEMQKKDNERAALEATKADIAWGNQIRSYVLDQSRIKDLRTGVETSNVRAVLDGALDLFIEASLKANI